MAETYKRLKKSNSDYQTLFNNAPISLVEIDWSDVKEFIDKLRFSGVDDFDHHFETHIEDITHCISLIKIITVNDAALDLFKANDIEGFKRGVGKMFTEDSFGPFKNQLVAFANGELSYEDKNEGIDLEGNHQAAKITAIVLETNNKPWSRVLYSVEDITWKKEFQRFKEENERKYEQLLQTADEGIGISDLSSRFTYVNKKFTEITGYSSDEMIGMSIFKLFDEDKEDEIKEHIKRRFSGISERYEIEGVRKDGTKGWVLLSASPIYDEAGQITGSLGMVTEITGRKMAEQALKEKEEKLLESEQLYRMLSENSENVIAIVNKKLDITFLNDRGSKRLGKSVAEIIGMNACELYDKKTFSKVKRNFEKAFRSGREVVYTIKIDVKEVKRWVEVRIVPIENNDGKITSCIATSYDITDLREEKFFSESLNEINDLLNSSLNFKKIFKNVLPRATEILGTESSAFFERGNNAWILRYHRQGDSSKLPVGQSFTDKELPIASIAAKTKLAFSVEDASQGEQFRREAMEKMGIRSALMIPLTRSDKVIGVVCFCNHTKTQQFTERQLDFSNKFAASLSLSFENARLYKKEREENKLSLALNEINSAIHLHNDLDKVLDEIIEKVGNAFGCDVCALNMRTGDHWVVKNIFGMPREIVGSSFSDDEARTAVLTHETKKTVVVNDALNDDRINVDVANKYGIRSCITAPIFMGDSMIGVIDCLNRSATYTFSKTQIDYLNKIAASISFALN